MRFELLPTNAKRRWTLLVVLMLQTAIMVVVFANTWHWAPDLADYWDELWGESYVLPVANRTVPAKPETVSPPKEFSRPLDKIHEGGRAVKRETSQPRFRPTRAVPQMPPIVDAPLVTADDLTQPLAANDHVLGVVIGDEARAYPLNMLTGPQREIINDTLGGERIAATW